MELFDLTKRLFDRGNSWNEVTNSDKSRHAFMVNRFMSIKFPMQANILNNRNVDPRVTVDIWKDAMSRLYTKPPVWMYTKVAKKEKEKKKSSKIAIDRFMKLNKLSRRDFDGIEELFSDDLNKELKEVEAMIPTSE